MKLKSCSLSLSKTNVMVLALMGLFLAFLPEMGWCLKTTEVIDKMDAVQLDVVSIVKAHGIKILTLLFSWGAVFIFALLHKPLTRPLLCACVVTGGVMYMHKWL